MNRFFIFIVNVFLIHQSYAGVIHTNSITNTHNVRAPGDKVKVAVYYENLNTVNRKFFIDEFKTVIDNLWDIIDLELVPYGNTTQVSPTEYECPFGEKQCFANRIQACAVAIANMTDDNNDILKGTALFTHCMFKNREFSDIYTLAPHCATYDLLDEWPSIDVCEKSEEGDQYYNEMAEKTQLVQLTDGLAVQINGQSSPDSVNNLVKAVCDAYEPSTGGEKPERCESTEKAPKVKVGIYYEALNQVTNSYFKRQIRPLYHIMEDIVEIDLIPYGNTEYDSSNGNNFTCDSEDQCVANRIHAVVVNDFLVNPPNGDEIDGPSRAINFINCMSNHNQWLNIYRAGEQCSNQHLTLDDWIHVLTTALGSEGEAIYLQMREKTEQLESPLPRVPYVTIDGEPSVETLNDFTQEVCARYTGIKPSICTRVEVKVYYESLNHKSRKFILEELRPAFNHFQNLINLVLLPAGRAHLDPEHGGIVCPGGVDQCDGNKLQACVIDSYWNDGSNWTDPIRQEVMEFLYCMSKNKNAVGVWRAAEQCSERNIEVDPWPAIFMCMRSGTGDAILGEYIEETQSAGIDISEQNIPVVTINGTVSLEAVEDLIAVLCLQFDEDHRPDECFTGKAPKLEIGVYYESMSELSKIFFSKQMGLYYKHIEEMVDIQLYPNGNVRDGENNDGKCETNLDACVANKVQAIVIDMLWLSDDDGDQIDGSIRTTQFLSCVFSHPEWNQDWHKAGEFCADNYLPNDEWFDIIVGANTEWGEQIYSTVQNKTQELKDQIGTEQLSFVPYVTLNGRHSLRTANDLLQTVCDVYTGEKPLECTPVVVEVYYETLNAQSRKFILEELRPTFEQIRESFTLDFIPFGRSELNGTGNDTTIDCPNGEPQCLGNKIQACAVKHFLHSDDNEFSDQYDGKNQTLSFIYCMFKNVDNEDIRSVAQKCANQHFLDDVWIWDILLCAESEEGLEVMREMAAKTNNIKDPLEHSPWIVINGERSGVAQTNLQQVICDNILGDRPEACEEERPPKVKIEFHYQTGDSSVQKFVTEELYPSYRAVEEIIDLEVVPFGQMVVVRGDDGNYNFTCTNGDNECAGNKIHACVYEYFWHNDDDPISDNMDIDGRLQTLDFIECYFSNENWPTDPYRAGEQCANDVFIDMWPTIDECARSGEIDPILAQLQDKVSALSPPLIYTPWVTINGKHNKASEKHFTRAVCDSYKGQNKPWACYAPLGPLQKPSVEIHYEPLNTQSQTFVVSQLDHLLTHVDEIVSLDILPFGRTVKTNNAFQCANDADCHTYKQHACVVDNYLQNYTTETLNFLICAFGPNMNDVPQVTEECVNENFVDGWRLIEVCAQSEGDQLLEALATRVSALNPKLSHVPWILVDGEHNLEAEENLIQEICDTYYPDDKPSQCIPELLSVAINYQSMEESVKEFFAKQIQSIEQYVEDIASFEFVPYGLTTQTDNGFTCPKEDIQCNANKVHTCVLHNFYDKENHTNDIDIEDSRYRTIAFLICAFDRSSDNPITDAEVCLNQEMGGDYWGIIDTCAHGPDGNELYKEMAAKTEALNPPLDHVPWVTINDTFTIEGETNLIHAICQSYASVRPAICSSLAKESVDIDFYYSSDQKSRDWVVNQLQPFYSESTPTRAQSLQSILSSSFIPWGNTQYDAEADEPFTCTNGPEECLANRIHACAINQYESTPKGWLHITEFIICFFSNEFWNTNPAEAGNQCANKVWFLDPWPQIDVCATQNTPQNIEVYLKMRQKTEETSAEYFPWVTVNNDHSTSAEDNLLGTVCDNYSGIKPEQCTSDSSPTPTGSPTEGSTEGSTAGSSDGSTAGSSDGSTAGSSDGSTAGSSDGSTAGSSDGSTAGSSDGSTADASDGTTQGLTAAPTEGGQDGGALNLTIANCLFIIMSLILFL